MTEPDRSKEYLDYRVQCQVEARTPLDYREWLGRMARFCYTETDELIVTNPENV